MYASAWLDGDMRLAPSRPLLPACLAALVLVAGLAGPAQAADPPLTVAKARLAASFHCPQPIVKGGAQPIMVVTGTGYTGAQAYEIGKVVLSGFGRPVCYVDFPYMTTGDVQIAAEYLVNGIRRMYAKGGQRIAMLGVSQGGLLMRWALTYWPSLRTKVTDAVSIAGTQHGTNLIKKGACSPAAPCTPATWQQAAGSNLLTALNRQPDESPGPTDWTTVRSATDETVQPQTGKHPTSALKGATNILIQDICPGRVVGHIPSALDSVTYEALVDAFTHKGPAKVSRFAKDVCAHPMAPGATPVERAAGVRAAGPDVQVEAPKVGREPKVRAYALKRVK